MTNEKRPTIGQQLISKTHKNVDKVDPRDYFPQEEKYQINKLVNAISRGKEKYPNSEFIIQAIVRTHQLLKIYTADGTPISNRDISYHERSTCPYPNFDQTVFKYNPALSDIEVLWTIPSKEWCKYLIDNMLRLDNDQKGVLKYVMEFKDGTLLKKAKIFNKEDKLKTGVILEVLDDQQRNEAKESGRTIDRIIQSNTGRSGADSILH